VTGTIVSEGAITNGHCAASMAFGAMRFAYCALRHKNVSVPICSHLLPIRFIRFRSMTSDTPVGRLQHLAPVLRLSETPPRWARPMVPLGYHQPVWPAL